MKTFLLMTILLIACLLQTNAQVEFNIEVNRLSDRVALLTGDLYYTNVLVVKTQKGLVMIDAPFSNEATICFKKAAIKEFNSDDFIYLINSHTHLCHVGGNSAFKDISIIGHEKLKSEIIDSKQNESNELSLSSRLSLCTMYLEYLNTEEDLIPDGDTIPDWIVTTRKHFENLEIEYSKGVDITTPNITFDKELNLDLGDLTIKLIYYGYAHSSSDIVIHIPEEKLLFTGGIMYKGFVPISEIDKSASTDIISNWLNILEYFSNDTLTLKYIIPSHDGIESLYDKQLLIATANYFKTLYNQVKLLQSEGKSLEEVKEELKLEGLFKPYSKLVNSRYDDSIWEIPNIHHKNIDGVWNLLSD